MNGDDLHRLMAFLRAYKMRARPPNIHWLLSAADLYARSSNGLAKFGKLFATGRGPLAQTGGLTVRQVARQAVPVSIRIQLVTCAYMHPLIPDKLQSNTGAG